MKTDNRLVMNERSLKGKCCRKEDEKKGERIGLNVIGQLVLE